MCRYWKGKKNYIKNPEKTILLSDNMFDYIVWLLDLIIKTPSTMKCLTVIEIVWSLNVLVQWYCLLLLCSVSHLLTHLYDGIS